MKAKELVRRFRDLTDDLDLGQEDDMLWSDAEVLRYLDQAQDEACRRSKLISDSSTSAVVDIALSSGVDTYSMHSKIIRIENIVLNSTSKPVDIYDEDWMDFLKPAWRLDTGDVGACILYWGTRKIRVWRQPTTSDTLNLTVKRLPIISVTSLETVLEIPDEFLPPLVNGMMWYAYQKADSQTFNPEISDFHHTLFSRAYGDPTSAREEMTYRNSHKKRRGSRAYFI